MHGTTVTLEYLPAPQVTMRLEGRYSQSKDAVYPFEDNQTRQKDFFVMLAIAIQFKNSTAVKMRTEPGLKDDY